MSFEAAGSATRRRLSRRTFLGRGAGVAAGCMALRAFGAERQRPPEMTLARVSDRIVAKFGDRLLCEYQIAKPAGSPLSVESGCFFHPVCTPSGLVVTDLAPDDHRHHRGVFLGWVEMRGGKNGDFWGWGEPAPAKGRVIVNRSVEAPQPALGYARFRVVNDWMADGQKMLGEDLRAGVGLRDGATALDLAMQLSVEADLTLARWAFGGFAVRTRKDATVVPIGPSGPVTLAAPKHTDPASNWPDAPWYGLHLKFKDGKEATVVVVGRKTHPPTTWHVVSSIGLINPCITAPGPVVLGAAKPLVLRYQVLAFDGPPKLPLIQGLAEKWYHGRT